MSEAPNLNEILESAILLFFKTLYDFNPYLRNPDEQERLINMPNNVKTILREKKSEKYLHSFKIWHSSFIPSLAPFMMWWMPRLGS